MARYYKRLDDSRQAIIAFGQPMLHAYKENGTGKIIHLNVSAPLINSLEHEMPEEWKFEEITESEWNSLKSDVLTALE